MEQTNPASLHKLGVSTQCVRVRKNGERCRGFAMIGTTICAMHGGKSPNVLMACRERMGEIAPQAIARITEFLTPVDEKDPNRNPCPLCRRAMPHDPNIVARIAVAVLDRTGMGPTAKLDITHKFDDEWVEYATESEIAQMLTIMAACRERIGNEPIEAEVLSSSDEQESIN